MFKMIDKLSQVKGCTVYATRDGVADQFPATIDANVQLPQISHPTSTIQSAGDMEIPDQTRINNMTTTISCEAGVIQSKLMGFGVQKYILRWAQEVKKPDNTIDVIPFVAYISGIPAQDVSPAVNVGENTTSDMVINTFTYRLLQDGEEIRYIDKSAGIIRINGIDYREKLNSML